VTQQSYEQINLGDEFDFSSAVSNIIFTTFLAFAFAPGLPILYPLAAMNLGITYWTHKTWLLKFYRKPPNFGPEIIKMAVRWLKFAFFAHCVIGILMFFGQPQIFYDSPYWLSKD
jgi:hypothetical protein